MAGMRYQPQGRARLNPSSRLARASQALIVGGIPTNLATGKPLTTAGTGAAKLARPVGLADSFRKNFYRVTEMLPAIGTQSFVEFWVGYVTADLGIQGSSNESAFLTGSSNNQTGIARAIGQNNAMGGERFYWGALTNPSDWSKLSHGNGGLGLDTPHVLVTVRRQDRFELWRNGELVRTIMQAAGNITASKFLVGSFIENTGYWPSSSDMLLAGRAIMELSADEVRQFSNDPWQLFADTEEDDEPLLRSVVNSSIIVTPAALLLSGGEVAIRVSRRVGVQPAALAVTGGDISLHAARKLGVRSTSLTVSPGQVALKASRAIGVASVPLVLQPGEAGLRATRRLTVAPVEMAVTGQAIGFAYTPAPPSGSYAIAVAPAAVTITGGEVRMRVTRRLKIQAAHFAVIAQQVECRDSVTGTLIDATAVPAARTVVFGGGKRAVIFNGGIRVVEFSGGIRTVRF